VSTTFEIREDDAGLWALSCMGGVIRRSLRLEQAIRLASRYASQCSYVCEVPSRVAVELPDATIEITEFGGAPIRY
jgi:hypothetical protein